MYKIMYKYKNQKPEEIDSADTYKDAKYLLHEYQMAYGSGSSLWIKRG